MNRQPWVLLDVNNLSYRNGYALKAMEYNSPVAYGLFRDLKVLGGQLGSQFVFCFDCQGDPARKSDYPEYKANRKYDDFHAVIKRQVQELHDTILPQIGYANVFQFDGYEADDLIADICQGPDRYWIVSTDTDYYQLLEHQRVRIWNPIRKCPITQVWLYEAYDLTPAEYHTAKTICGCKADNISGIPGVGFTSAVKWLKGTLNTSSAYFQRIQKDPKVIERNDLLMTLPYPELISQDFELRPDKINHSKWALIMNRLGIRSLTEVP